MNKWFLLPGIFLISISCEPDISDPPIEVEDPQEQVKYESKNYYLQGVFDNHQVAIRDTFYTIVGSTLSVFSSGQNPDSVTLAFGIDFKTIDPTGKPLETFNISFDKREAVANLDSKHNYKDLSKINGIITEGSWEFSTSNTLLKNKGITVAYLDQRKETKKWSTQNFYEKMPDNSKFTFQLDSVVNNPEDHTLVVAGSFDCILYNFASQTEQKSLKAKFRGPIMYYWN